MKLSCLYLRFNYASLIVKDIKKTFQNSVLSPIKIQDRYKPSLKWVLLKVPSLKTIRAKVTTTGQTDKQTNCWILKYRFICQLVLFTVIIVKYLFGFSFFSVMPISLGYLLLEILLIIQTLACIWYAIACPGNKCRDESWINLSAGKLCEND